MSGTAVERTGAVRIEHCMGTIFTVDIRGEGRWDEAIGEVVAWLHGVDALFSTYREDSEISALRRGDLRVEDADPDVRAVLDLCAQLEVETDGYFTALWDGRLDPTGLVKGWAIERAADILRRHGSHNHAVNGGGDMQLAGEVAPGEPWRVGIADPRDAARLLTIVEGRDCAVATSGVAERGAHIVDPVTAGWHGDLASVTVVGRSLTRVDAYSTAAFAMGEGAVRWLERQPGHEGLVVSAEGVATPTSGFFRP